MSSSWFTPIDSYCERIDATFWAEPINALSNGAFIAAALFAFWEWRKNAATQRDIGGLWLIAVTTCVGIGSFLFHTLANRWSLLADVLPIALFIYSYFFLAMRRFLQFRLVAAILATVLFAAFSFSFGRLWFAVLPGVTLNGSVGYLPAALAMLGVGAICLFSGALKTGRALLLAAGVFGLSLTFRSIDNAFCAALPIGTHFLWHVLNGVVLGILMIAVIRHAPHGRTIHAAR